MARTKAGSSVLDAITPVGVAGDNLNGAAFSAVISMNDTRIINLLNPVQDQDAATKQYVDDQITNDIVPLLNSLVPAGTVIEWGNAIPPADWLVCDGQSLDAIADSTLTLLFSTIGTTYGGTGSSNFNLPDLRGRKILGHYSGGAAANRVTDVDAQTIGNLGGDDGTTTPLTAAQLPIHNHTGTSGHQPNHAHTGTTGNAGGHTHRVRATNHRVDSGGSSNIATTAIRNGQPLKTDIVRTKSNHSHSITGISTEPDHSHTFTTGLSGGTAGHENIPPFQTINYIIKIV